MTLGRQWDQMELPGMPAASPRAPEIKPVSENVVRALTATDSTKPVGMRGSMQDRIGLAGRIERRDQNRGVWQSEKIRMEDEEAGIHGVESHALRHPGTGLPIYGELMTQHDIGFRSHTQVQDSFVPADATFEEGTKSSWRLHGRTEFVPTPNLITRQATVSSGRLNDLVTKPETRTSPRFPEALGAELPNVFHDDRPGKDEYHIVNGNHRLSTDLLQGRLFSEARVLRHGDMLDVRKTNTHVKEAVERANKNPRIDHQRVFTLAMNNVFGEGGW